jgi:hypothetical protein
LPEFWIIRRGATSFAQDAHFLKRNEIGVVAVNFLGDGSRTLRWFGVHSFVEKLRDCPRQRFGMSRSLPYFS